MSPVPPSGAISTQLQLIMKVTTLLCDTHMKPSLCGAGVLQAHQRLPVHVRRWPPRSPRPRWRAARREEAQTLQQALRRRRWWPPPGRAACRTRCPHSLAVPSTPGTCHPASELWVAAILLTVMSTGIKDVSVRAKMRAGGHKAHAQHRPHVQNGCGIQR